MKRSTAWCLGFGAALAFYWSAATFGGGFDWRRHYRLMVTSDRAEATVTSVDPQNHNTAHYEFDANGQRYRGADQGMGGVGVGDTVIVYYLPADPTFSTVEPPGEDLGFTIIAPLVLSVLAGFIAMARVARTGTGS
jgi:hypothetical protein